MLIVLLLTTLAHGGCAALVIGGAAGAGGYYLGQEHRNIARQSTDQNITAEIRNQFAGDELLGGLAIGVETHEGVVTLEGTVRSQLAASRAVELARGTRNVKRVVSRISVQP
jgi:osmotically-inducible protein OsmY